VQRGASRLDPFPSEAVRRDRLTRLIDLLCTNQDQLCSAVVRDFGRRSAENTKLFDILPPINALKYAAAHLTPWLRPRRRRSNFPYNWVGGDGPESEDPRCLAPRLVLIGGEGGSIMEEEIFGPVLPVVAVDGMADAIHRVGSRARPLAVYYFGNNRAEIELITREVACGGLVINDLMMHFLQDDLPFGGVGDSGMGGYHGPEGFERFSHAKSVFKQSNFADIGQLLRPPYGARTARLLKMQIRR